jgi:surface protein
MYSVQSLVIGAGTLPDSFSVASLVAGANFDYSGAQRNTDYIVNYQHINQLSLTGPIIAGVSLANAFSNLYTLTSITGLSNLDTHATTDMSHMFEEDQYLVSVDLSHFNTSQVTDMSHMFDNVDTLNNLNLSTFDTSNVTNMSYMFQGLSLNSLNLSNFNTAKVSDMSYMFNSDLSLTALDLSSFTISSTTNTTGMLQFLTLLDTLTLGAGIATLNNSGLSTRSNPNLDGNWVSSSSIVYSADNLTNNWSPNMAGTYTAEKVPWPSYSVVAALTPVWDPTISITDCFNYALSRNGMSANASIVSIVVTDSAHAQLTYNYSGSQYTMDLTLKTLSGADVSVPSILSTPGTTEYAWKTNGGATLIGYFTLDVL